MRIEWIEVENFKGFDKRRFEFDEHFTLIVGENGTGKTSLLSALCELLAFWLEAAHMGDTLRQRSPKMIRVVPQLVGGTLVKQEVLPLHLKASVATGRTPVTVDWVVQDAAKLGAYPMLLLESMEKEMRATSPETGGILPLFACFRANRAFTNSNTLDWLKVAQGQPSRKDGYLNWETPDSSVEPLIEWLAKQESIALQEQSEPGTYTAARKAIARTLPAASKVWFSMKLGEPLVTWDDSSHTVFSNLSDGQRSILAMVGDIARRCALLNPQLGDRAPAETTGVVLIDEIDLHLHPRWQRRIMEDLRRVFPKIQFIATTHSPIIISAAKDAKVIVLEENGTRELNQAYGLDVNWVVEELQGGEARPGEIAAIISKADDLIEEGKFEEARKLADELRRLQRGPSLDSTRIDSTIDNLIALAHAED